LTVLDWRVETVDDDLLGESVDVYFDGPFTGAFAE
jgi:hypothetical protein